jgi:dual specificity phosphatase 12
MQILVQSILCGMKEMETRQMANLGIHQELGPEISENPMGNHINPEKETNETPGSEVNQELVDICQGAVVETDMSQENQAVPEASLEVNEETMGHRSARVMISCLCSDIEIKV